MPKKRTFSPAEKVAVIRRHLLEGVPVSQICDELNIQPTQFYSWQKQFFENGQAAFQRDRKNRANPEARKIEALEEKLRDRNEVVAELLQEHTKLKKEIGEL